MRRRALAKTQGLSLREKEGGGLSAPGPAESPPDPGRGGGGPEITGVSEDSRETKKGFIFAALPGAALDGRSFIPDALSRGAEAVLLAPPDIPGPYFRIVSESGGSLRGDASRLARLVCGSPDERLEIFGITGTNGKTTCAALMEFALKGLGRRPGVMGTTGYRWGDVRRPAPNTTPEGPLFWVTLKDMANGGADSCVMEVSSHALALGRTEGLRCAYALFTNLSRDHLDFHPDMEGYFQAKRLLFTERLKGGGPGPRAAVNADDPYGARLKGELGEGALSFGFQSGEIRGKVLSESREGVSVSVMGPQWETEVRSKLLGGFNAENLLASLALLSLTGAGVQEAARLLGGAPGAPGRLERAGPPESRYLALVDYAHSPGALTAVVAAAKRLTGSGGRLIVVFGCGGDRDRGKRPLMGAAAAGADLPILTSDNPRTEDPEAIMLDAEPGLAGAGLKRAGPKSLGESEEGLKGVYFKEADRRRAIELGCRLLRPQDALLIAGKGHEDYQIIGRAKHPFDDRAEAEKALAALGKGA